MEKWRMTRSEVILARTGKRRVEDRAIGSEMWCAWCQSIVEKVDSWGECLDCGEPVWWVDNGDV